MFEDEMQEEKAFEEFKSMIESNTYNGDCDRCVFSIFGECHLQCTHIEEEWEEYVKSGGLK